MLERKIFLLFALVWIQNNLVAQKIEAYVNNNQIYDSYSTPSTWQVSGCGNDSLVILLDTYGWYRITDNPYYLQNFITSTNETRISISLETLFRKTLYLINGNDSTIATFTDAGGVLPNYTISSIIWNYNNRRDTLVVCEVLPKTGQSVGLNSTQTGSNPFAYCSISDNGYLYKVNRKFVNQLDLSSLHNGDSVFLVRTKVADLGCGTNSCSRQIADTLFSQKLIVKRSDNTINYYGQLPLSVNGRKINRNETIYLCSGESLEFTGAWNMCATKWYGKGTDLRYFPFPKMIVNQPDTYYYTLLDLGYNCVNEDGCVLSSKVITVLNKPCQTTSGFVYQDLNANNIFDLGTDMIFKNVKVGVFDNSTDTDIAFGFSDFNGYYKLSLDKKRSYTISVQNLKYYTSTAKTIDITDFGQNTTLNFALQPTTIAKDICVKLTNYHHVLRGFEMPFKVEIENVGTLAASATLAFSFPNYFTINSTSGLGTSTGNNTWYYPNLIPGQKISGYIDGYVSATAPIEDYLHFAAYVNQNDPEDSSLVNNTSSLDLLVYGSLDPNDKAGPSSITPAQVAKSEFIEYTIRFQNVGNAPAVNVVIADTLSQNLLSNTFELLSTSHSCKTTVKGNQVHFEFLNIMLLDSVNHEPESHGYVRFRLKPKNTLVLGSTISNTASIYFDYNSPIVTNTVVTKVSEPIITELEESNSESGDFKIFSNPTKGNCNIISKQSGHLDIMDISGQLLHKQQIENQSQQIDISELKAGTYLYRFTTNEGVKFGKVVKQ